MLKNPHKHNKSAHVLITIILLIVTGALGYVVWNNFFAPKKEQATPEVGHITKKDNENIEPAKLENQEYSNNELSFLYPSSWSEVGVVDGADEIVRIKSNDYKQSIGMGLDDGAELTVNYTNQQEVPNFPGIKDIREIKVDGFKGYRYSIEYEGYHLKALFTIPNSEGDTNYVITMQTAGPATTEQLEVFNTLL